ncbi:ABC transporter ATP-binding protein [Aliivibrio sp. EL58]|uniref:ABC transporter ATP-binding protein n=1 Tax=Aliivibrio sp. EL58 TaxID=2107582 RepID=UPI000EFC715C|nr:ABC transporter ATP-binding protein [Aliivibrio sp. EL58]
MSNTTSSTINWNWLFRQAKTYKSRLIVANIIAIVATLISVPIPLLMPLMVDEVLLHKPSTGVELLNSMLPSAWQGPIGYILLVLVMVIVMRIVSQMLNIYQGRQFSLVSKTITYQIRLQLLDKLSLISMKEYESRGSGGINSHIITDIDTIDKFLGPTLSRFIVSFLTVIGTAGVLLWINWQLGLFILLVNPIVIYFSRKLGNRVKDLKRKENQSYERFQTRLIETLDGIYQLRASNRERAFLNQLKSQADEIRHSADQFSWQSEAAGRLSFLLFLLGFELFRAAAMIMVLLSDLSIGQMFAIFSYLWVMLSPIQELLSIQFSWYGASAALKRVNALLHIGEEPKIQSDIDPFNVNTATEITINNLNFSYNDEVQVLNDLSLTIRPGEKVALVGASGGGKSTLIQLLLGLYQPTNGEILFNGHSTKEVGFENIRNQISVVLQQPILFNDTLRHNLTLGEDYSDDLLWNALDVAQLQDVVIQLTDGLDTQIGRQGVKLSGGQRQRLAIARMVLTNPKFVILDEATSALDTATEAELHKALSDFLVGRTTLIVAHRLSAVKQADTIYVLDDGKVSQSGTHHELVTQQGLYQTLYGSIQS